MNHSLKRVDVVLLKQEEVLELIGAAMRRASITLAELSRRSTVSLSVTRRSLSGEIPVSLRSLCLFADALGLELVVRLEPRGAKAPRSEEA